MVYETLATDFFYENSGITSLSYYITADSGTIYTGRAFNPRGIKINVRKAIDDWLVNDMPDFRDYDGVMVVHEDAYKVFGLYTDEGTLLEEYGVFLTNEEIGLQDITYRGIDGKADPRQKIFVGTLSENPVEIDVDVEVKNPEIIFDSPFVFGWESGTSTICYTANTDFTLSSYEGGWFTVTQTKADEYTGCLTFTYSENSGDRRDGTVCFVVEGGVTICFPVEQSEHIFVPYFNFLTPEGQTIPARVTTYTVAWDTNYDSVVYVFNGVSTTTSNHYATLTFPANTDTASTVHYSVSVYTTGGTLLGTLHWTQNDSATQNQYLTFAVTRSGSIRWTESVGGAYPYYSFDEGQTWTRATGSTVVLYVNEGDRMLFKGNDTGAVYRFENSNAYFNLEGNIQSMHYGDNFVGENIPNDFRQNFRETNVVSAVDLFLPSGTSNYCYQNMFFDCGRLTTPPALPATVLSINCYDGMFMACSSLSVAPELPATTLEYMCYSNMFYNCTSLTTPPVLPATTLAESCYSSMFYGCTSLAVPPALPATTLENNCYNSMFKGCTSLISAPVLPATVAKVGCYEHMFEGCTSLTAPPALPATTMSSNCYEQMFMNCTNLRTAPVLPASVMAFSCYRQMFRGCTSLTAPPVLPSLSLAGSCYSGMFRECTSLATVPELPATTMADSCYASMFSGCTSITTPPELPSITLNMYCYTGMFYGCTNLRSAPVLPATTLEESCYSNMFYGCTSLTAAPELPAATVPLYKDYCYAYMFKGCSSISSIKCMLTSFGNKNHITEEWVDGVNATGTFIKASGSSIWTTGTSGIPSGWTVQDAV